MAYTRLIVTYLEPIAVRRLGVSNLTERKKNHAVNVIQANILVLSHREAVAASPADFSICGEEDPGEALEFLVTGYIHYAG